GRFVGQIDEVRVYSAVLPPSDVQILATSESISEILAIPGDKRTDGQRLKLRSYFLERHAPAAVQRAYSEQKQADRKLADFIERLPTVMVMEEMLTPRQTHVLIRG